MLTPEYWDEACVALMKSDPVFCKWIPKLSHKKLCRRGDAFETLARSVVSQQISVQAADTVWGRLEGACGEVEPQTMATVGPESLAQCGLSRRKVDYLLGLSQAFLSGQLQIQNWPGMTNEEIIDELTQLRGIGEWTAQMFLIFHLLRPDVLPLGDLGLLRAIRLHYFNDEPLLRSRVQDICANWTPWSTVATWFLWRSLEYRPVDY